jgi:hypothetical protein
MVVGVKIENDAAIDAIENYAIAPILILSFRARFLK